MKYYVLDAVEINKSNLPLSHKNVVESLVSNINEGYKVPEDKRSVGFMDALNNDIDKLNKALRLYRLQHAVSIKEKPEKEVVIEDEQDNIEDETEKIEDQPIDYIPANGFYDGKIPASDIDSNKWFYDSDRVEWVGYPNNKEYSQCTPDEVVRISRYSVPDWEVYVPLEYQRTMNYQQKPKVTAPIPNVGRGRVKFTPRVGRSVGRVLQ